MSKKEIILCSIDASTKKTGVAIMSNEKLKTHLLLDFSKYDDTEERIWLMCEELLNTLNKYKPDIVVIEDSWNAMNVQTTKLLTRVMGVSYAWAIQNKAHWECLLPSHWRKLANITQGKKKRAELKQASIDYVKEHFNIDVGDDEADACAIGVAYYNYYHQLEDTEELFG